jgi:hypothetical protein
MATIPKSILNRIKQLASSPPQVDLAISRAEQLPSQIDLSRYSPSAIARATLLQAPAMRGFSESIVSSRDPFGAQLMRPSTFHEHTPPLDSGDEDIIQRLQRSLAEKKLQDLPLLWIDEYNNATHPQYPLFEAGYEGRHRMEALKRMYGDDPVLMNLTQGNRYRIEDSPYYSSPVRNYESEATLSPLELIKQKIRFGDSDINLSPLWMKD